eukprot:8752175-Ditylum_brightwellii.AAC.1
MRVRSSYANVTSSAKPSSSVCSTTTFSATLRSLVVVDLDFLVDPEVLVLVGTCVVRAMCEIMASVTESIGTCLVK